MGIATILVVMAGFWRSFYGTVAGTARLTLLLTFMLPPSAPGSSSLWR
jgi:hypothetical protein